MLNAECGMLNAGGAGVDDDERPDALAEGGEDPAALSAGMYGLPEGWG